MSLPIEVPLLIDLPGYYMPLEACNVSISDPDVEARGSFATWDGDVIDFVMRHDGEIIFMPHLPQVASLCQVESAIYHMVGAKRRRRAYYEAEDKRFLRASKRTSKGHA